MTSGPVMIQVLEGENAIAKNRDLMGATDPKKAAAERSAPISRRRSTPTPCTARTAPTRRRSRSPISFRRSRSTAAEKGDTLRSASISAFGAPASGIDCNMTNLLDLDAAGLAALLRRHGREAVSREAGAALGASALRRRHRRDDRPVEGAAREARRAQPRSAARGRAATRRPPTARASGCSTSAPATRSRRSTSPRTTAARCASRRRRAARSTARSARPASRASTAT